MNTVTRCPDCLDGPVPGAQWDYRYTNWQWRECETCRGTGRVHDLSGGVESRHANAKKTRADLTTSVSASGSSAPPAQNCGHVPDTEEQKAQDRYEQAKHDAYMDRRLEAQEDEL